MHIHVYPDMIILVSSLYEHLYMHIKTYIHYSTCLCAYVKKTKYLHEKTRNICAAYRYIHTYRYIYIYIIYIEGWSGYLYTYIHVDIYIHAYTYIERFKVLRFDTVAKNGNADGVIE